MPATAPVVRRLHSAVSSALQYATALTASLSEFRAGQLLTVACVSAKYWDLQARGTAANVPSYHSGLAKGEHHDYPQV